MSVETMDPIPIPMLSAVASGTSDPVALNNTIQHWHEVVAGAGVASGVVVFETAGNRNETGAWEVLNEYTLTAPGSYGSAISYPGPGGFVRHRITTPIGGGTVNSFMRRAMRY